MYGYNRLIRWNAFIRRANGVKMAILTRGKVSNNGNVVAAIFSRIYMISSDGNLADGR